MGECAGLWKPSKDTLIRVVSLMKKDPYYINAINPKIEVLRETSILLSDFTSMTLNQFALAERLTDSFEIW